MRDFDGAGADARMTLTGLLRHTDATNGCSSTTTTTATGSGSTGTIAKRGCGNAEPAMSSGASGPGPRTPGASPDGGPEGPALGCPLTHLELVDSKLPAPALLTLGHALARLPALEVADLQGSAPLDAQSRTELLQSLVRRGRALQLCLSAPESGELLRTFPGDRVVSLSPDMRHDRVALGLKSGPVRIHRASTGELVREILRADRGVVSFSPDGEYFVSASGLVGLHIQVTGLPLPPCPSPPLVLPRGRWGTVTCSTQNFSLPLTVLLWQNHHPRVLPKAFQWKVVSMCKSSRSCAKGLVERCEGASGAGRKGGPANVACSVGRVTQQHGPRGRAAPVPVAFSITDPKTSRAALELLRTVSCPTSWVPRCGFVVVFPLCVFVGVGGGGKGAGRGPYTGLWLQRNTHWSGEVCGSWTLPGD